MATSIEIIRANLMGLPEEITDDIIQIVIDTSASLHDAAIALCDSAASVVESEDIKLGSLALKSSGSDKWLALKDNLIKRAITGNGVIINPDATTSRYAGLDAVMTGDDIPNQFTTGQFDNPPAEY